jgi:hypothetical protein
MSTTLQEGRAAHTWIAASNSRHVRHVDVGDLYVRLEVELPLNCHFAAVGIAFVVSGIVEDPFFEGVVDDMLVIDDKDCKDARNGTLTRALLPARRRGDGESVLHISD